MTQTQIQKKITADSLEIIALFPSGSAFRFASTPAGFGIGYVQAKTPAKEKERRAALDDFCKPLAGENRLQHAQRIEAFLRGSASTTELVAAIQNRNLKL